MINILDFELLHKGTHHCTVYAVKADFLSDGEWQLLHIDKAAIVGYSDFDSKLR